MAEARDALRRIGIDYHCVMFDLHPSEPCPSGASLTVTADGSCVSDWFTADEIEDSEHRIVRPDVKQKIAKLVSRVREDVTA
jgi:LmbE family N-acetylglucosaminyl deacetylase